MAHLLHSLIIGFLSAFQASALAATPIQTPIPNMPPVEPTSSSSPIPPEIPAHLAEARNLISHIDASHTDYTFGASRVTWADSTGGNRSSSYADCSGLIIALLSRAYGLTGTDLKVWSGSARPNAALFHDLIVKGVHFESINLITDAKPGDLVAIKYQDGGKTSGHIAVLNEEPKLMADQKPIIPHTKQWTVGIIDSAQSGHGPMDTRSKGSKAYAGLGQGALRIYTDEKNAVTGYSWSPTKGSTVYTSKNRHLVIGRLRLK